MVRKTKKFLKWVGELNTILTLCKQTTHENYPPDQVGKLYKTGATPQQSSMALVRASKKPNMTPIWMV